MLATRPEVSDMPPLDWPTAALAILAGSAIAWWCIVWWLR
jgi:hypothetical protein